MADVKNVFISHIHEDDAGLGKLKDLLLSKGMRIRDGSISTGKFNDAKEPNYIKYDILSPLINWAGTFICYISPQTKASDWVNWEIETAAKLGKRIIGVWQHGDAQCELPDALKELGHAVVGWNGDAIIDAINGRDDWQAPDGSPFPIVPLKRHPC